jgi:hypothetical protein
MFPLIEENLLCRARQQYVSFSRGLHGRLHMRGGCKLRQRHLSRIWGLLKRASLSGTILLALVDLQSRPFDAGRCRDEDWRGGGSHETDVHFGSNGAGN